MLKISKGKKSTYLTPCNFDNTINTQGWNALSAKSGPFQVLSDPISISGQDITADLYRNYIYVCWDQQVRFDRKKQTKKIAPLGDDGALLNVSFFVDFAVIKGYFLVLDQEIVTF